MSSSIQFLRSSLDFYKASNYIYSKTTMPDSGALYHFELSYEVTTIIAPCFVFSSYLLIRIIPNLSCPQLSLTSVFHFFTSEYN